MRNRIRRIKPSPCGRSMACIGAVTGKKASIPSAKPSNIDSNSLIFLEVKLTKTRITKNINATISTEKSP
jgi:hypothetical protein